ncbi:MAG: TspO/MBR family protein [Opitutaceae bacterium]|nr:TspO/MBR family protein [Opitutaceae bacterium]
MSATPRLRFHPLLLFLATTFAAGLLATTATLSSVKTWYPTLHKPEWTPPNWIFAPVWTLLYVGMAVAAWRVWRATDDLGAKRTFRVFRAQLVLNALWSILFFGLRRPDWALVDMIVLWAILMMMTVWFWRVDRIAGAIWSLYAAWVTYAFALNAAIWNMN